MKKLLLTLMVVLPLFAHAQKIDEQKLKTQLKALAKSSLKQFNDLKGKVKSIEKTDTTFYSTFKLLYSAETNTIANGYYYVRIDCKSIPIANEDMVTLLEKIITETDFGFGKMEPGGGREGLDLFFSKSKKINNKMYSFGITVHHDSDLILDIHTEGGY